MTTTRRTATRTLALATTVLLLAACSEPGTDQEADGETGSPSSSITVYTSEPQAKIDEVIAAFNEEHPDTEVQVFRAGTGDLKARIASEQETGEVAADVLLAADAPTFEAYKEEDLLLEYRPADVDALLESVVDPDGYYVGTRIIPTVIAYNTTEVEDPPTSWAELTDPSLSGMLVMPNPDVSGAAAYNAAVWSLTPGLGEEWFTALGENDVLVVESNGPTSQAIADGSRPVGVVVDYLIRDLAEAGSPVAVSYPEEGIPYIAQPAAIFAATDNPEGAQAFVDFLVSAEGQELAVQQAYLPVRGDVGTPEGAPALDELTFLDPGLEQVAAEQEAAVALFKQLVIGG